MDAGFYVGSLYVIQILFWVSREWGRGMYGVLGTYS